MKSLEEKKKALVARRAEKKGRKIFWEGFGKRTRDYETGNGREKIPTV